MILYHVARAMSPIFFKKCQMHPNSQDQWQIAKFILDFKSTHSKCVNFDGVRVGSIFFVFRLIIVQCGQHRAIHFLLKKLPLKWMKSYALNRLLLSRTSKCFQLLFELLIIFVEAVLVGKAKTIPSSLLNDFSYQNQVTRLLKMLQNL